MCVCGLFGDIQGGGVGVNNGDNFDINNCDGTRIALSRVKYYTKMASFAQQGAFEGYEEALLKEFPEGHPIEYYLEYMVLKYKMQYQYLMFLLAQERYRLAHADDRAHEMAQVREYKIQYDILKNEMQIVFFAIENSDCSFSNDKMVLMSNLADIFQEKLRRVQLIAAVGNNRIV